MKRPRTPSLTSHTEGLRLRLAEARERLGLAPQQVADRLVDELTKRRSQLGAAQLEVARNLAADAGEDPTDVDRATTISNWERMEREPRIDQFAAWARAVGMRLIVELEPAESPRTPVLVAPETKDLAAAIGTISPEKVPAATMIVERMLAMTPGEVRRLAAFLASEADE